MPFERQSLAQLLTLVSANLESELPGYSGYVKNTPEYALSVAMAGLMHGVHGHLSWLSKQVFADTAEGEYLARIAAIYGVDRIEGAKATGTITFYATKSGVVCPAGTVWVYPDGTRFIQNADETSTSLGGGLFGKSNVAVTAAEKGVSGNVYSNIEIKIESPQLDLTGYGLTGSIGSGADDESDTALLSRLLLRLRTPTRGGSTTDYVQWALEVPGTTRAWARAHQFGMGTVGLCFVRDGDGSGSAIIPITGEVSAMQDYLDAKRPATATVTAFAPVNIPILMSLSITPNTTAVQNAITSSLSDFFLRESYPGAVIRLSKIAEAISSASGEVAHEISSITVNSVVNDPPTDITLANDEIGILGAITFGLLS